MNLTSTNLNQYVMQQMGVVIAKNPKIVADLLEANEVALDLDKALDPLEITDSYLENLPTNDSLKLGSAYLVNRFEDSNFDGTTDDESVKEYFQAIDDFWNEEDRSNWVGAVAGALGKGAELGKTLVENKQKKKFFGSDLAEKQSQSRQALLSGIMAQKQQEALIRQKQIDSRNKKLLIIGSIVGVTLILATIVFLRLRKNA